ncbi:hypothetical protein BDB01DRAFT_832747 [Pilobolus umbonatus]|nr:hypothetical protein BDB01DRAFT_832747 [Pilobolus umbonatus]
MARWSLLKLQNGLYYAVEGLQTIVKNPSLRKQRFIRLFLYITVLSFIFMGITNILVAIPIHVIKMILSLSANQKATHADELLTAISRTIQEIAASIPFFALLCMRYVYPKAFDDLFMETLRYLEAMNPDRPLYSSDLEKKKVRINLWKDIWSYLKRTWNKSKWGILLFCLSFIPFIGKFVFPLAGAYTTYTALGKTQAVAVGVCFFFLPRWATMKLIRALIGMRSLLRELFAPYFARKQMTHREKRDWFDGKRDTLFAFSAIAYVMIRMPIFGVIGYGIVQATTAYMLTVVIDPPAPHKSDSMENVNQLNISKHSNSDLSLPVKRKGSKVL